MPWEPVIEKRLIYRSQPFGFDTAMLAGILSAARRNNPRYGITGALICRHDLYLQLIEGPTEAVDALYAVICEDDRHFDVRLLLSEAMGERLFPNWAMLDDTAPSQFWSAQDVASGALEMATPDELRAPFVRLSAAHPGG
ncbi:BLUF domain-containing protein [Porphyrobacter sp. TH134]|uniref:BLUF domain-containing protein n=1 Tax=Porphyrobacter sp. TH134 TaxID=2067450 RepID=UPI0018F8700C|nr:BLUF domain-containing protein [Porphyrobacter sp. TH134]